MQTGLIEKALEISRKRRRLLEQMREAVKAGDREKVFGLAQQLTGTANAKAGNRTDPGLN